MSEATEVKKPVLKDLDKLVPEPRVIKLAGTSIDVSTIPARAGLEAVKMFQHLSAQAGEGELSDELFYSLLDLAVLICKKSFPTITKDWLLDNADLFQLIEFLEYVVEPLSRRVGQNPKLAQLGAAR